MVNKYVAILKVQIYKINLYIFINNDFFFVNIQKKIKKSNPTCPDVKKNVNPSELNLKLFDNPIEFYCNFAARYFNV